MRKRARKGVRRKEAEGEAKGREGTGKGEKEKKDNLGKGEWRRGKAGVKAR